MADAEDPVAITLRRIGWRQGDIVSPPDASRVLDQAIDQRPDVDLDEHSLILLTQDCDILREREVEPYLEFIAVSRVPKANPQLEAGRSVRRIHIPGHSEEDGEVWLDCSIHDRFRVPKASLAELDRKEAVTLGEEAKRQLRQWVARRYTRQPFPDAFERRLGSRQGRIRKLFAQSSARLISTVYIATSNEELPDETPYEVDILLAARGRNLVDPSLSEAIDDFEHKVEQAIEAKEGIVFATDARGYPRLRVIAEDDLTLGMIRRYKRFDVDYRSSDADADSPPVDVDQS